MSGREHFGDEAPGLAALHPRDPALLAAREHASGCAECARALREAERLHAVLERWQPAPLPAGALERVSVAVLSELRREARRRTLAAVAAVCGSALIFTGLARSRSAATGDWARAGVLAGLAIALAAAAVGRPLLVAGVAVVAALAAGLVSGEAPLAGVSGLHCLATELAAAGAVAGAAWLAVRRSSTPARPALSALAATGALAGDAALQVTCGAQSELPHLLAFHVGGVLLAAAIAAAPWRARQRAVA